MLVDVISDTHLDFWIKTNNPQHPKFKAQLNDVLNFILPVDKSKIGDVLIIAGDISHSNLQTKHFLVELKKYYKHILIVHGNHCMYLLSNSMISDYKAKSENRLLELKEICDELEVIYLDGQVHEINGIYFGGTCSWYNLPTDLHISRWKQRMNDSRRIYSGYAVQPYGMYMSYSQPSTNWNTQDYYLKQEQKLISIAENKCDVFITHVPLQEVPDEYMNSSYIGDLDNIFYYTDNLHLVKNSEAKIHVHGHTHQVLDYEKDKIRIICNPLGYPSDKIKFKMKQFEIEPNNQKEENV